MEEKGQRLSYICNNIIEVGKISRRDEIVLSFYYEDYCEYGLSYDWEVYYYDDSDVIARFRLMLPQCVFVIGFRDRIFPI